MGTFRTACLTVLAAVTALAPAPAGSASPASATTAPDGLRPVVFVGNNWEGTADVLAPGSFAVIDRIDVVPDRDERMAEIAASPDKLVFYTAIKAAIGEGNDQLVDDMYASNDGELLVVSRPSFADVVGIDLGTREVVWRFPVAGYRSDHMAVSPDGRRVVVSASTANLVHVLRVRDGRELGTFPSGGSPHESVFVDGGRTILHASIGTVYSPIDRTPDDPTEQERVLQLVDARTLEVRRRYDLRAELDRIGREDMSTAVRPLTLSPDERTIYLQVSFFHGFLEMDRRSGRITRVRRLPNLAKETPREAYVLDSAHHGIAMNPRGTRICVAGTMSDYATVVRARSLERGRLLRGGEKPYWVTPSADGRYCYISWAGSDTVSRIGYRSGRIVDTVAVGDHPQRVRTGVVRRADVG